MTVTFYSISHFILYISSIIEKAMKRCWLWMTFSVFFFFFSKQSIEKWQRKITIYVFMCIRWHLIPVSTPVRMRKFDFCHNGSFPLDFCLDFSFLLHRLRSGQSIYPLKILVKRYTFSPKRGSHGIFLKNKRIRLKSTFVTVLYFSNNNLLFCNKKIYNIWARIFFLFKLSECLIQKI